MFKTEISSSLAFAAFRRIRKKIRIEKKKKYCKEKLKAKNKKRIQIHFDKKERKKKNYFRKIKK